MKIRRSTSIIYILYICFGAKLYAQDPIFTQFYANPIYLNPALTGTTLCPKTNINYRLEWPSIEGTYITTAVSLDQHINALGGGLGLLIMHDNAGAGILRSTNISGSYAYYLKLNRGVSLKFGLQATLFHKNINWDKFIFEDMIDPELGIINASNEIEGKQSKTGFDISSGIFGYGGIYYGGIALHHINRPDEGLNVSSRLPRKFTAHMGAKIPIGEKYFDVAISPNILFQQQQNFSQLNIGVYLSKGPIVGGFWYRGKDATIVLVGLRYESFKVGYSYDITVSKLRSSTAGSHEISSSFTFKCKPKKKKFLKVECPNF